MDCVQMVYVIICSTVILEKMYIFEMEKVEI